ncbi:MULTISPECIES: sigma-70 family RNA polymerase sigma factor [Virgibacillus]|nr:MULTISPECIES: sigma-70 family RNA polymerase sigma factor [Virgibacillus]MBS7429371.1 sigma-70 family RNA polymerase sigma factor [Virgibacillus sp. 19R1-5]MED3737809.1 sigma-70 family RNA polymerase sigma factor [Virgibacillus pantothenticus]QTY15116.1 sigma-70 family RNA polymerase sigma factor [Virgibacillus pantothenticus]
MKELELVKKCKSKMNQPVIRNFLKDENNYILLKKVLEDPSDEENKKKLDNAFQNYYKGIKIIGYLSKLIYFYSIDYDKRRNNYKNKTVYPLKKESSSNIEQDFQQIFDIYISSTRDLTVNTFEKHQSLLEQIEDESLFQSLQHLKPTQLRILELIYSYGLKNKEVAEVLGKSEQTVSYNHRAALKKIKNVLVR